MKDPRSAEFATGARDALEAKLSYLTVSVPDARRVDGLVSCAMARCSIRCCGIARSRSTAAIRDRRQGAGPEDWSTRSWSRKSGKITVDVPKFKDLVVAPAPKLKAVAETPEPEAGEATDVPTSRFTTKRKVAVVLVGAGAATLVAGFR